MSRYYVTMTWDDFPEGGSYGTVIETENWGDAEDLCRAEMAKLRANEDNDAAWFLDNYGDDWEVIDCWDLDDFIARWALPPSATATTQETTT